MGTDIKDWAAVEGAYYTGYGSAELFWLILAIVLCVLALIVGARHEHSSYKKLRK